MTNPPLKTAGKPRLPEVSYLLGPHSVQKFLSLTSMSLIYLMVTKEINTSGSVSLQGTSAVNFSKITCHSGDMGRRKGNY